MQTEELVGYKLSPQQRLVWRLAGQSGATTALRCTVRCTVRIAGDVQPAELRAAIRAIVARHEMLRTRLEPSPAMPVPVQMVSEEAAFHWREGHDDAGAAWTGGEPPLRFPLTATFLRERDGRGLLTLDLAATHGDRASLEIMVREIAALLAGEPLAEAPLQYADLSTWLDDMVETAGEGKDFWRAVVEASAEDVHLAGERILAHHIPCAQAVVTGRSTRDLRDVTDLASHLGITRAAVLLGCWQALIARLTCARRLPVGVTLAGRSYEGMESAVGLLERQVPVIARIADGQTLWPLLSDAHTQLADAAQTQEYFSWEEADRANRGLAACGFAYREMPAAWVAGGLEWTMTAIDGAIEPNKVALCCTATPAGLVSELYYDASLFEAAGAEALLRQFDGVISAIACTTASTRLADVDLVGPEERAMLASFNPITREAADAHTIIALFEAQAARTPAHVAVSSEAGDLTYAELDRRAASLADRLIELGAGPDQAVGMCVARGPALIVTMLAIWKAGAAYMPLDDCPAIRLRYTLANSGARIIVTEREEAARFDGQGAALVVIDDEWRALQTGAEARVRPAGSGGTLAYIIYTSGSTGEPKGVMVEHHSLVNHMHWALRAFGLGEQERMLMKTSVSFDAAVWEWLFPLLQGGVLVLAGKGMQGDSQYLARLLHEQRITTLQVVPAMLRVLVEEPALARCVDLRRIFAGGEALDAALIARCRAVTGRPLINLYGPTEATIDTTSLVMEPHDGSAIGRPVANTEVYVLSAAGDLAAIGEAGEIHIAGAALARGYIGRADDTAERFLPNPFSRVPGDRLYRTGDVGRHRADGVLEFLGRQDGQVKIRGYRIELGDVERAIYAQPGVAQAAVVVKTRAGGERQLVAYVESAPAIASGGGFVEHLRAGVRTQLPEYMCPAQYVRLARMPRTPGGKLDRQALPEPETVDAVAPYVAPRTANEETLAGIWSSVLGVPRVSVTDNFFEIGGDSILGIQIVAPARQAGLSLTPRQLFQHQTIAALAQAAAEAPGAPAPAEPPPAAGALPLTPIQRQFFVQAGEQVHHFNQAFLFAPPADVRVEWLDAALAAIVAQHDALRLRFDRTSDGWRQRYVDVDAAGGAAMARVDLRASPDQDAALRAEVAAAHARLDITNGPLLRATWFDLGDARGARLLIVAHHLVVDGVSWRILLEDLAAAYAQVAGGVAVSLPPRTSAYRRWAEGLVAYADSPALDAERAYWRNEVQAPADALAVDDPAGGNTVADEEQIVSHLSVADTRRLLTEAGKAYNTQVQDALMSALVESLHRWRGHSVVRVALEGHGREDVVAGLDLTRTIGWFTSLYPVRLAWRDGEAPGPRLQRMKAQLRAIPGHGLGYGVLRYLRPDAALDCACPLVVNYLGQLDNAIGRAAWLPAAREGSGPPAAAAFPRAGEIELNAFVIDGQLQMAWTYSGRRHHRQTVAALAASYGECLRELIDHCTSPTTIARAPVDGEAFNWSASQVSAVAAAILKAK
jgi:amino acid adenylation domain-containing protein/non-ribosomal peptide synthase protein (TIGR01720 family)